MAALIRCALLRSRNLVVGRVITNTFLRSNNLAACLVEPKLQRQPHRHLAIPRENKALSNNVEDIQRKLDLNQGIPSELFQLFYTEIQNCESPGQYEVELLLYLCSDGPFDLVRSRRMELCNEIWDKLDQFGVQPSSKLYNMRLRTLISTESSFNPLDELKKMKEMGLQPDRVTYGLLIEAFCQQGDTAGAELVLEALSESKNLLEIQHFNSFITGHLKSGNVEEAEKLVEVIKSRGLFPNADTYYRFAQHYAEKGDLESVEKYFAEADDQGLTIAQGMRLDLYITLVKAGHTEKAQEYLSAISEQYMFNTWTVRKICQLASEGYFSESFSLYSAIPKFEQNEGPRSGSFLIKALINNGATAGEVMEMADNLVELCPTAVPHKFALLFAYKAGRIDLAMELLKIMQSKNFEIKLPYVLPAVCEYRNKGDVAGTYKAVAMLMDLVSVTNIGFENSQEVVDELSTRCLKALMTLGQSQQDILDNMKDYEAKWNSIFFTCDMASEGCEIALANAQGKDLEFDFICQRILGPPLTAGLPQSWHSGIQVLEFMSKLKGNHGITLSRRTGQWLISIFKTKDMEAFSSAVDALKEKNLKVDRYFTKLSAYTKSPNEVKQKLDELIFQPRQQKYYFSKTDLEAMPMEQLEAYRRDNPTQFFPQLVLLNKAMDRGDTEDVKYRLRALQVGNFTLELVELLRTISWLCQHSLVDEALGLYRELKERTENTFKLIIPLSIAEAHMKQGDVKAAVEMIREADDYQVDERSSNRRRGLVISILDNCNSRTRDEAWAILEALVATENVVPMPEKNLAFHHHMKNVLDSGATDEELMSCVEKLYEQHQVFPCLERIMIRFIQNQDVERLKTVMSIGIQLFGNNHLYHRLAMCFIQCGLPAKAAAVLQHTPGIRINPNQLVSGCTYLIKNNQISQLESLVELSKQLPVSRVLMLNQLILGYLHEGSLAKAMGTLAKYEEEHLRPHNSTINTLVRAHNARNEPIPELLQAFLDAQKSTSVKAEKPSESPSSTSDEDGTPSSDSDDEEPRPQDTTETIEQASGTVHKDPSSSV